MLVVSVTGFAVAWWLGCYVLSRDPGKPLLRRTSAGLFAYAAGLAFSEVPAVVTVALGVSALAWTGVLLRVNPESSPRLERGWLRLCVPLALAGLGLAAATGSTWVRGAVFGLLGVGLAAAFAAAWRSPARSAGGYRTVFRAGGLGPMFVFVVLFALGMVGLLLDLDILPRPIMMVLIGIDLIGLGFLIAVGDAIDEGQLLARDMARSAAPAAAVTVLFASQVAIAMAVGPGDTPELTGLLYGCVATAIAVQVLAGPLNRALDRLTLPREVEDDRTQLRNALEALPRRGPLDDLDADQFVRLVRRALSNYADVGRLAGSPLVTLPEIDRRLAARDALDAPLERAAELKAILRAGIDRLKPEGPFGLSDEWRYYNSLYYIYVVGLRPYSQRARHMGLSADAKQALEWFKVAVPQRSLHNWQNAAAHLIADTLGAEAPVK